jgi:hypothetical protein
VACRGKQRRNPSAHERDVTRSGAVVFTEIDAVGRGDIWLLRGGGHAEPLVRSPFDDRGGVLSPDERILAYESDQSGPRQLYVKTLGGTARQVVAPGAGSRAWWDAEGQLLYENARGLWEVTVGRDGAPGVPRPMLPTVGAEVVDATRGAVLLRRSGRGATSLHLTLEAAREISRLLPPPVTPLPR